MVEYDPAAIETRWQAAWAEAKAFDSEVDSTRPKFYCLEMFPYPSGQMHMGHVRNYSIGDSMARFRRLSGYNVLYPMGYDSFGMPAENAAKKIGGHPHDVTWSNIESIRSDLQQMGFSYDWRRELATSDSTYYRWNQWIFLKFHEMGLVERRTAPVNWCDTCDTVLANEQVKNNRCWRCADEVRQKDMAQWFLKMTAYADELLDELEVIEFPENVKAMQRNWIGRSHGAEIRFPIVDSDQVIEAFTTRSDTIFGVTFLTLAPEHPLCNALVKGTEHEAAFSELALECARMSEFDRINMLREKKGVFLGRHASNPLTGEKIPIYAGNFVVASYGTGAVMAVPAHDQRDFEFAAVHGLDVKEVLIPKQDHQSAPITEAFTGEGWMVNSGNTGFDGLYGEDARAAVITALEAAGMGEGTIQYRLKDWLLSRQRFWGTPIPFVHCKACGVMPVPEADLPIALPLDVTFTEGQSGNPLASHEGFVNTSCPGCGGAAKRETDTMDTFYDSSWYFLRFCDAMNGEAPFDKAIVDYWMEGGVDLYIGGIEHAVMHLLYARFFTKALRDAGLNDVGEPFSRLVCQGMVNAPTPYCADCNVEYHVDHTGSDCPTCGVALTSRSAKMSKSLGNTVSPEVMIEKFGADTVRLFILFAANPEAGMDWSGTAIESNFRQMKGIHAAFSTPAGDGKMDDWLLARMRVNRENWHGSMMDVSLREGVMASHFDMLSDWQWAQRRGGVNDATKEAFMTAWAPMIYPATPHLAEEWWAALGHREMLAQTTVDTLTPLAEDALTLAAEAYLRGVIDRARNVKDLALRHADGPLQAVVIQTAQAWKQDLATRAVGMHGEDFDFKQGGNKFLQTQQVFQDEALRGDVMQVWRNLVVGHKKRRGRIHTYGNGERALIDSGFDEAAYLTKNAVFISHVLDIESVEIYRAGEGEDVAGKARSSMPLEPGVAWW